MLGDHWKHPYKWSFYVKIDDDNPSIFNLRRFTLQPPHFKLSSRMALYDGIKEGRFNLS